MNTLVSQDTQTTQAMAAAGDGGYVALSDVLASTPFSRVSLSHLRQCLSPETSLEDQRPPAPKRPVEEEGEGEGEEEPKKKLSFGLSSKPEGKGVLPAKKPSGGISIKLGQSQVCSPPCRHLSRKAFP